MMDCKEQLSDEKPNVLQFAIKDALRFELVEVLDLVFG
ncbi:hypothetical protein FEDK69T_27310 [Flavobacterium enshiense DK69]|nr:hypothetical protein FEDK69T_27310 [Flavobacterium enshiense DK69]